MWTLPAEDEWVTLSEVEHWAYCPRQWALIHLEQWFSSNEDTVRGDIAHEHLDEGGRRSRGDTTTWWSVDVASEALGLRGRCDRVVIGESGSVIPIEHKSGRKALHAALLQLTGQAMCLEEMLATRIDHGRLYLIATKDLQVVPISDELRAEVRAAVAEIRSWRGTYQHRLPPPADDHRCRACSLWPGCMPGLVGSANRVRGLHGATWWP